MFITRLPHSNTPRFMRRPTFQVCSHKFLSSSMNQQTYHVIDANVAIARARLDDPIMADFVNQMEERTFESATHKKGTQQWTIP